ncbi:hypothetical protein [Methanobacterium sp. ACI-7]|uniref:hypothetical protein n=1 Tax=unclassified Methanobacterium TaxID=2627676 RepID=UPI0039C236EB
MIKNLLSILLVLIMALIAAGSVSSAPTQSEDLGTLTVQFGCGCTDSADGYRNGNDRGAIHYDIGPHNHPVVSAVLTFDDGTTITWNKINGLENAGLPAGYWAANWHWVYTPSGVLTISDAIGLCPCF